MKSEQEIDFLRLAAGIKLKTDESLTDESAHFVVGLMAGLTWALEKLESEKALFEGVTEIIQDIKDCPELTENAPEGADLYEQLQKVRDELLKQAEEEW